MLDPQTAAAWLSALVLLGVSLAAGLVATLVLRHYVTRWTARTETPYDDLLWHALRRHIPFWVLLGSLLAFANVVPIQTGHVRVVSLLVKAAFVLSATFAASGLASALFARYVERSGAAAATTSLAQYLVRIAVWVSGLLVLLANLGISITPLLTALGVGSLAVALALQPTLANLFAGLQISLARPFRVGDTIETDGGWRGTVTDIGWRATTLREQANDLIVIPNSKIADMPLRNFSLPEPEQAVLVPVGVAYGSDLENVERVALEVAREVQREVEGAAAGSEPFIRFHTFGDSAIVFNAVLRARQVADQVVVTHEFVKRLHARFRAEGIEIPFPQRVIQGTVELRGQGEPSQREE